MTATGTGSSTLDVFDWSNWNGTTGNAAYNNAVVSSVVLSFDAPVNVASLRFNAYDNAGDYVFTPNAGTAATYYENSSGVTVAPVGGFPNITSLTITRQDVQPFWFVLDDLVIDASLPVELTSFTALHDGTDAVLRWHTASETNNAGFEVQQQSTGFWTTLGFVAGHGTTLEGQRYAFRADGLAPGTYRFRLKQTDFDGAFTFSPEVELTIAPAGHALDTPATFADHAEVRLSVERGQAVRVVLYDLLGREVQLLHEGAVQGTTRLVLDGTALPSGVYFVRAEGETFTTTRQIVRAQ